MDERESVESPSVFEQNIANGSAPIILYKGNEKILGIFIQKHFTHWNVFHEVLAL